MTLDTLRTYSDRELLSQFEWVWTDRLPVGEFSGTTLRSVPVWPLWRGKVFFDCGHVVNKIGPFQMFLGSFHLDTAAGEVVIDYGSGITDGLRPVSDTLWLGQLRIHGKRRLWFALEQEEG